MNHINYRTTQEMVAGWQYGTPMDESAFASIEIIATFDHDWEHHLLIQEWDRFADNPGWIYSLWFLGGPEAELVHRWDSSPADVNRWRERRVPWVEAAGLVTERREALREPD